MFIQYNCGNVSAGTSLTNIVLRRKSKAAVKSTWQMPFLSKFKTLQNNVLSGDMYVCSKNVFERQNHGKNKGEDSSSLWEEGGDARGMERYTTVRNVVLY